jgi:hypothetical protein
MLWNTGYIKGRPHVGCKGKGEETKNLNVVDVLNVEE